MKKQTTKKRKITEKDEIAELNKQNDVLNQKIDRFLNKNFNLLNALFFEDEHLHYDEFAIILSLNNYKNLISKTSNIIKDETDPSLYLLQNALDELYYNAQEIKEKINFLNIQLDFIRIQLVKELILLSNSEPKRYKEKEEIEELKKLREENHVLNKKICGFIKVHFHILNNYLGDENDLAIIRSLDNFSKLVYETTAFIKSLKDETDLRGSVLQSVLDTLYYDSNELRRQINILKHILDFIKTQMFNEIILLKQ